MSILHKKFYREVYTICGIFTMYIGRWQWSCNYGARLELWTASIQDREQT